MKTPEEFLAFHKANPQVYEALVRYAHEALAAGHTKLGIQALIERVRWNRMVETKDKEFKINNDFAKLYAEFLVWKKAVPPDFFEFRERKEKFNDPQ